MLGRVPRLVGEALGAWREGGLAGARAWWAGKRRERAVFLEEQARAAREADTYARWIETVEKKAPPPAAPKSRPLVSVLVPVYETPEPWLRRAIESVFAQSYDRFELCLADDASRAPHVRRVLESFAKDPRVKVVFREKNGHIAACSNSALELASGEFVALLDHDDELAPDALARVVAALDAYPETDLVFSDEDKIDEAGRRFEPAFKGAWNEDLMLGANAFGHLGVYRTALVREVGGFRQGVEGCQDWDLVHRCAKRAGAARIRHVPHVLYHFRAVPGSTALESTAKPYMLEAALKVLEERFAGSGVRVERGPTAAPLRLRFPRPESASVAVIAPERFEAAELDRAARAATAEVLVFKAPGLEPLAADWLDELASNALRPEIGAAGAKLLDETQRVRHAGFALDAAKVVIEPCAGLPAESEGFRGRAALVRDVSAVSADCLAIRRALYVEAGGFDAASLPRSGFDVDLCLRLRARGLRVLFTPRAVLAGPRATPPRDEAAARQLRARWPLEETLESANARTLGL